MTSEVTGLLAALKDGSLSLDEVARRFRERTWPRRRKPAPATYLEMAAAAQEDPEPDVAGSFDDVDAAYDRGDLSDDEYDALAKAMAESLRAEDQGEGDGQS
jgi:hypothetical protein